MTDEGKEGHVSWVEEYIFFNCLYLSYGDRGPENVRQGLYLVKFPALYF
jgi:hypothetical protein